MDRNLNRKSISIKLTKLNVLAEACSTTTAHGLPNIVNAKYIPLKLIWMFCCVLSISLCGYLTTRNVLDFLNYEVVTKITVNQEIPIIFPTITICNRNPFNTEYAMSFINDLENSTDRSFWNDYYWFYSRANVFNKSDEEKKKFGLKLDETIIVCSFNSLPCNLSNDFVWVYYSHYGNCYRFNSGKNEKGDSIDLKKLDRVGNDIGLNLILYVGEPEHVVMDISTGIQIFIHNASENPGNFEGFKVATATETNFAIRRTFTTNLEYPYTSCRRDLIGSVKDPSLVNYILNSGYKYRFYDCWNLCYQQTLVNEIGCNDIGIGQINGTRPCVTQDDYLKTDEIFLKFLASDLTTLYDSKCPFECDSFDFSITTTNGYFPSNYFVKLFQNKTPAEIKERYLSLNIFYDTIKYTNIEVTPKTELVDLISNIGGTLGLFLGISWLSFIEIFEIIFNIIAATIEDHKIKKKVYSN